MQLFRCVDVGGFGLVPEVFSPILFEPLTSQRPHAPAFVDTVGAEALRINRRGAGAKSFALIFGRMCLFLSGTIETTSALALAIVLHVAGVVRRGGAIPLASAFVCPKTVFSLAGVETQARMGRIRRVNRVRKGRGSYSGRHDGESGWISVIEKDASRLPVLGDVR